MTLDIDPDRVAEYKAEHGKIWAEIRAALSSVGLTNVSLWVWGSRLFYYAEWTPTVTGDTFEAAMARYTSLPRVAEWEALMHTYQVKLPSVSDDGGGENNNQKDVWWKECTEVWSSDF
jgi:L-rhamnose mutarotase